jgi:hypothetical protein
MSIDEKRASQSSAFFYAKNARDSYTELFTGSESPIEIEAYDNAHKYLE